MGSFYGVRNLFRGHSTGPKNQNLGSSIGVTSKQPPMASLPPNGSATIPTMNLSYDNMQLGNNGGVLGPEQIRELRSRQGFCLECQMEPIRLYKIRTNRFNPLWTSREPRTVDGECINGKCLVCYPELNPNGPRRNRRSSEQMSVPRPQGTPKQRDRHRSPASIPNLEFAVPPLTPPIHTRRPEHARLEADDDPPMNTRRGSSQAVQSVQNSARMDTVMSDQIRIPTHPTTKETDETNQASISSIGSHDAADTGDPQNDSLELMYSLCRRMSGTRNLRPASFHGEFLNGASASDTNTALILLRARVAASDVSPQSPSRSEPQPRQTSNAKVTLLQPTYRPTQAPHQPNHSPERRRVRQASPERDRPRPPCDLGSSPGRQSPVGTFRHTPASPPTEVSRNAPDYETMVAELELLIKELWAAGNPDFTSDVIVNAMKGYPMATQVQVFCLSAIWDLCKDDDAYKASLISTSAPEDILLAMMNHLSSAAVQERGCGALWSLSVNQHNRIIVARAGAPARIIRAIIDHKSDESVVRTGIGALRNLSPESEIRETLVNLQASQRVAEAMAMHRTIACVQRDGCAFLSNSAVDLDRHQVSIVTDKEIEAVIEAIRAHPQEPSVVAGACFALKNYTIEELNLTILARFPNAVGLLEDVANHSNETNSRRSANIVLDRLRSTGLDNDLLVERACASMINLVQQQSVPSDAVSKVLEVMKEHEFSVKLTSSGLRSLLALANHSDLHRNRINDSALKRVVAAMRRHEGDSAVQISACGLLEAMASHEQKCRYSIFEGQGCIAIVNAMRQHTSDISVQVAACGALRALSIEFDCWFELEQSGNAAIVQEAMSGHPGSSMLQQLASDILTNFSAHCDFLSPRS
jgi:hypothetical protein